MDAPQRIKQRTQSAAHSVSQPQSVPIMRLGDDFIARTAQVDPNARKKKRGVERITEGQGGIGPGTYEQIDVKVSCGNNKLQEVNDGFTRNGRKRITLYINDEYEDSRFTTCWHHLRRRRDITPAMGSNGNIGCHWRLDAASMDECDRIIGDGIPLRLALAIIGE